MKAIVIKLKGFTEYYAINLDLGNDLHIILKTPGGYNYDVIGIEYKFPRDERGDIIEDSEEYRLFFQRIADKINSQPCSC